MFSSNEPNSYPHDGQEADDNFMMSNGGMMDTFKSMYTYNEDRGLRINNSESIQDGHDDDCPWHLRVMMALLGVRLASVTGFMIMESLMAVSISSKTSLTVIHFLSFAVLISVYVSMIVAFSYYSWMLLESALVGRTQIGMTLFALLLCILTIPSVPWF